MSNKDLAREVQQASIKKSSGPRTRQGKQKSRFNAIKHGIFSEVVLLPGESRTQYRSLLKRLQDYFQPEGGFEEFVVEKLVSLIWRHRRCLIAEGAEIRQSSEFLEWDRQNRERQDLRADPIKMEDCLDGDPALIRRIQIPDVLDFCLKLLRELRQELKSGSFNRERDGAVLRRIYGYRNVRKTLFQSYLIWVDTAEVSEEERQREGYSTPEECKSSVIRNQ